MEVYQYTRNTSSTVKKDSKWGSPFKAETSYSKEKTREINVPKLQKSILLKCILLIIMARAELAGGLLPFLPAFFVVSFLKDKKYWPFFTFAALCSLWFSISLWEFLINGTVLIVLSLLTPLFQYRKDRVYVIPIVVFVGVFVTKNIFMFIEGYSLYTFLSITFEGLLAGALVPSFASLGDGFSKRAKVWNRESLLGLVFLIFGILVAFQNVSIANFSVRNFLSRYLILFTSFIFGAGVSTPVAVIVGLVPSVASVSSPQMIGVYALSALLAGLFKKLGKVAIALGFLLGHFILSVYVVDPWDINMYFLETGIAIALFLATPKIFMDKVKTLFNSSSLWAFSNTGEGIITSKLNNLEKIFGELSRIFGQASVETGNKDAERLKNLSKYIAKRTCSGCAVFGICWQKDASTTYSCIETVFKTLKVKNTITEEDIPYEIRKRCQRLNELVFSFNCIYETFKVDAYWVEKLEQIKELVSVQLKDVSNIMKNMAQEVQVQNSHEREKELQFIEGLQDLGIAVENVRISKLTNGTEIEIIKEPCRGEMECTSLVKTFAEETLNERLSVDRSGCAIKNGEFVCRCHLLPSNYYSIDVGFAAKQGAGNVVSGDSIYHSYLRGGKYMLLLSDGMGVGARANRESTATVQLLQQFLNNGFDIKTAIQSVNSILSMRSRDDTFATVDLAIIDMYKGDTEIFKIGAAPSFVKRGNTVGVIKTQSLPIGIINRLEVESLVKKLKPGDIMVMVTDGVLEVNKDLYDKEGWMQSVLRSIKENTAQEMADMILRHALAVTEGPVEEDMSVLVAKIEQGV